MKKNQALIRVEPVPPRYYLGATTNYETRLPSHTLGVAHFKEFFFRVEESDHNFIFYLEHLKFKKKKL